jgi:hypothetical protein
VKINGYEVVCKTPVSRTRDGKQGYVIIVDREGNFGHQGGPRFVTSLWFEGDKEWCQGHYKRTLDEARAASTELCDLYGKFVGDDEEAQQLTIIKKENV